MARRGLFAEIHHQVRLAEREQARAARERERNQRRTLREAEAAQRTRQRHRKQLERATEAERKRVEKEEREAHLEAMNTEVEYRNLALADINAEIDSLLAATLDVDDFVDLETLRRSPIHPPFPRPDLESPLEAPRPPAMPPEPIVEYPLHPTGLFAFFLKGKHERAVAAAEEDYQGAHAAWELQVARLRASHERACAANATSEAQRLVALAAEQERFASECSARESETAEHNQAVEALVANLGYGVPGAVEEYISIVLSNSVYPVCFPVEHEFSFDPKEAELRLRVLVPGPDALPSTKAFKYVRSTDEISSSLLSQKAQRDRYASAVHQVALRTLHEVFEADRRALVNTITLEVGTQTIAPATGRETYIPFVSAAAEREVFIGFDLSAVVPAATLQHLGAAVSKNPFGLDPADTKGVRRT